MTGTNPLPFFDHVEYNLPVPLLPSIFIPGIGHVGLGLPAVMFEYLEGLVHLPVTKPARISIYFLK
jgi:hypothetical protein